MVQELHEKFSSGQLKAIVKKRDAMKAPNNCYPMPSAARLRKGALETMAGKKRILYRIVANNSPEMESRLSFTELKKKEKMNKKRPSPAKDYVKNFSKAADANIMNITK